MDSYPIKFLLLQKSELMYEVTIRGEVPSNTVVELRRQVTRLTQKYPSEEILDSCLEFSDDLEGVKESMDKVKANIELLRSNYQDTLAMRVRTVLNHIYYRFKRILTPEAPELITSLESLMQSFDKAYSEFLELEQKAIPRASSSKALVTPENIAISVTCDRGISTDVSKLKFDGKSCVRAFIQRVEEVRIAKGVPEEKMLCAVTEIFTGDALHWYRSVKDNVLSWDELILQLKQDFDVDDYDYRMVSEIRNRTQGESENITIYLSIMEGMFFRLSRRFSEEDKLEILLHNIRPCYSSVLATCPYVKSIHQLKTLCRNYERIKARSDNFREPPAITSDTLAPEFSYQVAKPPNKTNNFKSNNNNSRYNYNSYSNSKQSSFSKPDNDVKVQAITSDQYCYRCKSDSHSMRGCKADRVIICFKCGMKDVRTPECPKCNPKEQAKN